MSEDTPSKKVGQLTRKRLVMLLVEAFHRAESCWNDKPQRLQAIQEIHRLLIAHSHEPFIGRIARHLDPASITLPQLYTLMVPVERELETLNLRDEDFLPTTINRGSVIKPLAVTVVLENLRSAFNVGGVLRTCECMGLEEVVHAGYTATPEHAKVANAALGAERRVRWRAVDRAADVLSDEVKTIALEQSSESVSLYEYTFEFPCVLLLGNERFGLSPSLVDQADDVVHIPMHGEKRSLNVVAAFAMCAYEMRRQGSSRQG